MPDSEILTAIVQSAGAGTAIIVILLLLNLLSTRWYTRRIEGEADAWKAAYERERDAHQVTRDALVRANDRAEAAVESARVTKELLELTREEHRRRESL
jgi:hypothetical protein